MTTAETEPSVGETLPKQRLIDELLALSTAIEIPTAPTEEDAKALLERHRIPQLLSAAIDQYGIVDRGYIYLKTIFGHRQISEGVSQAVFFETVYNRRTENGPVPSVLHADEIDPEGNGTVILHLGIPLNEDYSLDRSQPLWQVEGTSAESYIRALKAVLEKTAAALAEGL